MARQEDSEAELRVHWCGTSTTAWYLGPANVRVRWGDLKVMVYGLVVISAVRPPVAMETESGDLFMAACAGAGGLVGNSWMEGDGIEAWLGLSTHHPTIRRNETHLEVVDLDAYDALGRGMEPHGQQRALWTRVRTSYGTRLECSLTAQSVPAVSNGARGHLEMHGVGVCACVDDLQAVEGSHTVLEQPKSIDKFHPRRCGPGAFQRKA